MVYVRSGGVSHLHMRGGDGPGPCIGAAHQSVALQTATLHASYEREGQIVDVHSGTKLEPRPECPPAVQTPRATDLSQTRDFRSTPTVVSACTESESETSSILLVLLVTTTDARLIQMIKNVPVVACSLLASRRYSPY